MIHTIRVSVLVTGFLVGWSAPIAWCQQPGVGKLYEQGVNAYFAGRSGEAEAALSEAIQWNPHDPRAYYFRALSLLRQGRIDESRGDMFTGAALEAQTPHRYAVGAALERVQGGNRLMLERYRRDARRDVVAQASGIRTQIPAVVPTTFVQPEADAAVIRQRRIVPLEELLRPEGPRAIAEEPAAVEAPLPPQDFAGRPVAPEKVAPPAAPSAPSAKTVAPPAAAAANNPFEDDSAKQPAETPSPPAAAPAAPAQPAPPQPPPAAKPEVAPPAEAEENPFGG